MRYNDTNIKLARIQGNKENNHQNSNCIATEAITLLNYVSVIYNQNIEITDILFTDLFVIAEV